MTWFTFIADVRNCAKVVYHEQTTILQLQKIIANLPILCNVKVSSGLYAGRCPVEGFSAHDYLRIVLRGVQATKKQLRGIIASMIEFDFLDDTSFSLHSMTNLLGSMSCINLTFMQELDLEGISKYSNMIQKGALRRALDSMPMTPEQIPKVSLVQSQGEAAGLPDTRRR